jgi:hypothetical protein
MNNNNNGNNTTLLSNQPIYSTNFNTTNSRVANHHHQQPHAYASTPSTIPADDQSLMQRFKSDSNLITSHEDQFSGMMSGSVATKYATYNPREHLAQKSALIQKTNGYDRRQSVESNYMSMNNSVVAAAPAPPAQPPRPNYKLIKNSQSTLMPSMQSAIIDNSCSLLQPISSQQQEEAQSNLSLVEKLNSLKMEKMSKQNSVCDNSNNAR